MIETAKIKLPEKDLKIMEAPQKLYEFLKNKYGVKNGEIECKDKTNIFAMMEVKFPGFPENLTKGNHWTIHLEKNESKLPVPNESISLIIGERNRGIGNIWSRFVEVECSVCTGINDAYYARCRYKIIANNLFEKDHCREFKQVSMLLQIIYEFLEQY
jgi:hypothetical protein